MITLTLLHPIKNTPVQSWSFDNEPVIRMGRATDNHVVLYSAVVSRRHVELHRTSTGWEVVNLGANGTFIDGERVNQIPASDGLIIRLARSGPSIQVGLEASVQSVSSPPSYPSTPPEVSPSLNVMDSMAPSAPFHENNGHGTIYDPAAVNAVNPSSNNYARQTIISEEEDDPVESFSAQSSTPLPENQPVDFGHNYSDPVRVSFDPQASAGSDNTPFGSASGQSPAAFAPSGRPSEDFKSSVSAFETPSFISPSSPPSVAPDSPPESTANPFSAPEAPVQPVKAEPDKFSLADPDLQDLSVAASDDDISLFSSPIGDEDIASLTGKSQSDIAPAQADPNANIIRFSLETGQPLQVQQTIGRYQVVKTIVQSNDNITYLAWRDGRSMALKTLNANWSDYSQAGALLDEEAQLFRELRHPGLPQYIDFFWVDGQPFFARDMVYGKNLEQYVATHGPVPTAQALGWIVQICDVLSYLHQQSPQLIHHDVKPRNIIRRATPQGNWEISLVGLQISSSLTDAGTQMGFPAYTAPEQQEGHPIPASDIYSLGPVLVYLLTGQEPELFYRYVNNEYRLVPTEVPGLAPPIMKLIQGLTELRPEARYPSAKDVSRTIQQILNNQSSMGTRL